VETVVNTAVGVLTAPAQGIVDTVGGFFEGIGSLFKVKVANTTVDGQVNEEGELEATVVDVKPPVASDVAAPEGEELDTATTETTTTPEEGLTPEEGAEGTLPSPEGEAPADGGSETPAPEGEAPAPGGGSEMPAPAPDAGAPAPAPADPSGAAPPEG
jgi:hypothetical protein